MAKRELNNKKYKGLTELICKKIEKIAKTDMGTFCGIDKRYIAIYGYLISITIGFIGMVLLILVIYLSITSSLIKIMM